MNSSSIEHNTFEAEKIKSPVKRSGWALAEGGSEGTWREALLELRTAYPAGLQNYGMKQEELGIYQRVSDMRNHLQRVALEQERRRSEAFQKKNSNIEVERLNKSRTIQSVAEEEEEDLMRPLNVYSQAIALQVTFAYAIRNS